MFGIKIVTKNGMAQIERAAVNKAIADMVELLRKKDKIFIEATLVGDYQKITDCVFLGTSSAALKIVSSDGKQEK